MMNDSHWNIKIYWRQSIIWIWDLWLTIPELYQLNRKEQKILIFVLFWNYLNILYLFSLNSIILEVISKLYISPMLFRWEHVRQLKLNWKYIDQAIWQSAADLTPIFTIIKVRSNFVIMYVQSSPTVVTFIVIFMK